MNFLMSQYDELGLDDWEIGIPNLSNDAILAIFNKLPAPVQGLAVSWGASDSVFRDKANALEIVKNNPHLVSGN